MNGAVIERVSAALNYTAEDRMLAAKRADGSLMFSFAQILAFACARVSEAPLGVDLSLSNRTDTPTVGV